MYVGGGGALLCTSFRLSGEQVQQVALGYAQGGALSTVLSVSLPLSPPFSVSQQAGRGLIKNIRTICAEQYLIILKRSFFLIQEKTGMRLRRTQRMRMMGSARPAKVRQKLCHSVVSRSFKDCF